MRSARLDVYALSVRITRLFLPVLAAIAFTAAAQDTYPARPVKIMVGASAGGGTDIVARVLADKFADFLRQAFVVENRPGASNTIAADITAKAPADGHVMLVATNTAQAIAPHLLTLGYDPLKDLQPIGLVVVVPNVLVVNQTVPAKDARELVALLKAKPGELRYASVGVGSTQHIAAEAFKLATGTQAIHVPYKGSSQAHIDLLGGSVEMMIDTTSSAMSQIKAGRLRPLAVASVRRSPELPAVPTLSEAGISGADMSTWYGLFVTGGTPRPIVDKLHAQLQRALKLPDVDSRLRGLGGEPGALSLEQFAEMNRAEYERFGALIRKAGIKAGD
jgi:tripartite-type tricarboxylate transporter receptor subunit TctC